MRTCSMPAILTLILVGLFASASLAGSAGIRRATDHPVLEAYGLTETDARALSVGSLLWLVRAARPLPTDAGLSVLGQRGSAYLVAGKPADVLALAERGCDVSRIDLSQDAQAALTRPAQPLPPGPSTPQAQSASPVPRPWQRITQADPEVQILVDQVAWTPIESKIQWLQDFGTRHSYTIQCDAAAESLRVFFEAHGLATELQSFPVWPHIRMNVIATQSGTVYPDSIFVICGHYDSTSEDYLYDAPGADDNASGTAAVMTAAQLFAPYTFEYTIKYICFAGEEQGLVGSDAWTDWAASEGLAIVGALNFDMIGWWQEGVDFDLEIESNNASLWLLDAVTNAADLYTTMPYEVHVNDGAWWGDHASFWDHGWAAINHEEAYDWYDPDFNPNYHSTRDRLNWINPDFAVGNVKIAVAALATLARLDEGPLSGVPGDTSVAPIGTISHYPNPFNGRVTLEITASESTTRARMAIYDVRGRLVNLLPVPLTGGRGSIDWNGRDAAGNEVGSGAYFVKILGGDGGPVKILYLK